MKYNLSIWQIVNMILTFIYNWGLKGFVSRRLLPQRYRVDCSSLNRAFKCIITYCERNSNILGLSALPEILAISEWDKRASLNVSRSINNVGDRWLFLLKGIKIGDKLDCSVAEITQNESIYFDISDNGKSSIVAMAKRNQLELENNNGEETTKDLENIYGIGSLHEVRVVGYRLMERILIVSNKKTILERKFVSIVVSTLQYL